MDMMDGFYWISDGGALPEIAELRDGDWWLVGCEQPALVRAVTVKSGKLAAPDTVPTSQAPARGRTTC